MAQDYLTVTNLTRYLKRKFEADPYLERVYLTGEISNFRLRANAHQYFSLKDDGAKISAIMFKGAFQKLKFQPKDGMKVLVVGRISLYEASGQYQVYVEHMEPDGVGALYQAFNELKDKLQKEGLFELPKQNLPRYPRRIAVLTSPSGAVVRDIITTVKRRYPIVELVIFPTLVQGDRAADNIVQNLKKVEQAGNFDSVILARGGGSIEDLWPFNEEKVARAIVDCAIPVVSSVGHETDTTIADLVADVRAATPTAAAELSVPVLTEEILKIKQYQMRLVQTMRYQIKIQRQQLQKLKQSYIFKHPERLYEGYNQKLDIAKQKLLQLTQQKIQLNQNIYVQLVHRLQLRSPKEQVTQLQDKQLQLQKQLVDQMGYYMQGKQQGLQNQIQSLDLLSPLKIMGRGYSYVTKDEMVIRSVETIEKNDHLALHLADGQVEVKVTEIIKNHNKK